MKEPIASSRPGNVLPASLSAEGEHPRSAHVLNGRVPTAGKDAGSTLPEHHDVEHVSLKKHRKVDVDPFRQP